MILYKKIRVANNRHCDSYAVNPVWDSDSDHSDEYSGVALGTDTGLDVMSGYICFSGLE